MDELTIAFKIESPPSWLPIGRTAENNWRTVEIDCSYWFNMNANGEVVLMYKPSCGMTPYPLLTERDGDNIIWRPKSGELVDGVGRLQAFFEVGTDVIGSSEMISCEVDSSLLGVDPGTDPGQTDLPWALDIIEQIAELSGHYPKIENGVLYVWDSEQEDWVQFQGGGGSATDAVLYTPQTLTPAQKAQARGNVGAISADDLAYVTPEQFGAVGDGVADDTDALQTAVRAGNVVCEAGKTYLISKPIIFDDHIYDFGGCTIKMADGYEINRVDIDGVSYGYCGLVFDNLDGFCVKNLTLDCNKAGNASTAITGAIFSDSTGTFENCTFQNATYKHLVINRGNNLHFYDTTLKNLGTAANCSDVYVSGTPESTVAFDGFIATRESGSTSTGQVAYINNGNFSATNVYAENCHMLTDSRSGNTVVQNAVVRNAKKLEWTDQESSRANPANITYENVYYYDLERTSGGYALQAGGVSSLTINNMFVQIASGSTFSHAFYFQSNSGKLNHNIRINGLRMDLGSVALQNALYFAGEDTTENVLLTDCHFKLDTMTWAYIARIANNPKNVRLENCTFDNFQMQWVYGNTNQHLLGVSNATPRRAATADLPTLTTADTGSIIFDTTLNIFKLWNGSAWIDPRPSVPQMATQANMSDWTSGKTVDAATMKTVVTSAGLKVSALEDDVSELERGKANTSDIPTAVSELTNDSGYQTAQDVQTAISNIPDELPAVSTSDNGKFLRVVNGDWAAQAVPFQTPRVAMASTDTTATLNPNTLYVFPEMASLAITLATPTDSNIVNEYHFIFTSGATATTLTLPASVLQPDGFTVEANHVYEVSIAENCMTAQGWAVTA